MFHLEDENRKMRPVGGNKPGVTHPWRGKTIVSDRDLDMSEFRDQTRRRGRKKQFGIIDPYEFDGKLDTDYENQVIMNSFASQLPSDERGWAERILDEER